MFWDIDGNNSCCQVEQVETAFISFRIRVFPVTICSLFLWGLVKNENIVKASKYFIILYNNEWYIVPKT